MLSPQRLAANRRNSQLSTGPRTELGKSNSSANSLKTGINSTRLLLPSEDPGELAAVTRAWRSQCPDPTPAESRLIDIQIRSWWLLQRLERIEADLKAQEAASALRSAVETLRSLRIGGGRRSRELRAGATRNDQFIQIARRRKTLSRDLHKAQNELKKLRAIRESQTASPAQLQQNIPSAIETGPFFQITNSPDGIGPVAEL